MDPMLKPILRTATLEDLDALVYLHQTMVEKHPKTHYLYPYRHQFPDHYVTGIQGQYMTWLEPRSKTWHVNIVEVSSSNRDGKMKAIGFSVWRLKPNQEDERQAKNDVQAMRRYEKARRRSSDEDPWELEIDGRLHPNSRPRRHINHTPASSKWSASTRKAIRRSELRKAARNSRKKREREEYERGKMVIDQRNETPNFTSTSDLYDTVDDDEDDDEDYDEDEDADPSFYPQYLHWERRQDINQEHMWEEIRFNQKIVTHCFQTLDLRPRLELENLATLSGYQGHGVGRMNIEWGIEKAKTMANGEGAYLTIVIGKIGGLQYEKMGLVKEGNFLLGTDIPQGVYVLYPPGKERLKLPMSTDSETEMFDSPHAHDRKRGGRGRGGRGGDDEEDGEEGYMDEEEEEEEGFSDDGEDSGGLSSSPVGGRNGRVRGYMNTRK